MTTTSKRNPPTQRPPVERLEGGDFAAFEPSGTRDEEKERPSRIERREWRGEGVVGNYHTD